MVDLVTSGRPLVDREHITRVRTLTLLEPGPPSAPLRGRGGAAFLRLQASRVVTNFVAVGDGVYCVVKMSHLSSPLCRCAVSVVWVWISSEIRARAPWVTRCPPRLRVERRQQT